MQLLGRTSVTANLNKSFDGGEENIIKHDLFSNNRDIIIALHGVGSFLPHYFEFEKYINVTAEIQQYYVDSENQISYNVTELEMIR